MIAGLLGEHLASPRTATKTNQNTALETNPKRDSAPPSEDGFAAYVAKEPDVASQQTPSAEEAVAAAVFTTEASEAPLPSTPDGELAGLDLTATDVAVTDASETGSGETEPARNKKTDAIKPEAVMPDASLAKDAAPTAARGEVVSADPRVRAAAPPQGSVDDASNSGTIKLAQDATPDPVKAAPERGGQTVLDNTVVEQIDAETADVQKSDAEALRATRSDDSIDAKLTAGSEVQARTAATDTSTADRVLPSSASRDTPLFNSEPTVSIGLATSGSTPAQVNVGLNPTPASIPVATPSDLTSVILNAIKNGADPQEQLVVQLDPPELGRVLIDFKFDAQGVQQITVTSENPEALKRLRELHFELTQALRENGLSDPNMSFRQEAGEQSHNAWQSQDQQRSNAPLIAAEDRRASPSAIQALPNVQARDRLDLLL